MSVPKVSVIMPVYNAIPYLSAAIESILKQTFTDFEFIIVNDGSSDRSLSILKKYEKKDNRIQLYSRKNTGIVGALNEGISYSRTDLLARMDADDISLPERLERQVDYMSKHRECVALGTDVYYMDADGAILKRQHLPTTHKKIEVALLVGNSGAICHPALMLRKESLDAVGKYRREAQFVEDLDLLLRLSRKGSLINLSEPLLKYRIHFQSTNFKKSEEQKKIKIRILETERQSRNLPFDKGIVSFNHPTYSTPGGFHRQCAYYAISSNHKSTALKHAWKACVREPLRKESLVCLNIFFTIAWYQTIVPMGKTDISVILCTHNPKRDYLNRSLESISKQTLPKAKWEVILVDNASDPPLEQSQLPQANPNFRLIKENTLGLTRARLKGIKEARGESLVFLDDDNILASDYLAEASQIAERCSWIGVWGGNINAEFEITPPEWINPFLCYLAVRSVNKEIWSNQINYKCIPYGAGFCVRKVVAREYAHIVEQDEFRMKLDRQGDILNSGGDSDPCLYRL